MSQTEFNLNELMDQCSQSSLGKALVLEEQRAVFKLSQAGDTVTAQVRGSGANAYQVKLNLAAQRADCTCPAAEYQAVCKHAAAVILQLQSGEPAADEDEESALVRGLLAEKSHEQLIDLALELLADNEALWQKWLLQAQLAQQAPDLRQLKKLITAALPARGVWEWHAVREYFDSAYQQFEAIWAAQESLPVEAQFQLTEHALKRLNKVLQQIDDSGGSRFDIEGQLNEKLPDLFAELDWPAKKKADWLFGHIEKPLDLFPDVPDDFSLDTGTEAALNELCTCALENALQHATGEDDSFHYRWQLDRLARPLVRAAERKGDWREQVRIGGLLAQRHYDYLRLSELCLEHNEPLDAEHWLGKALKVAKAVYEQRQCQHHQVKISLALNEPAAAWKLAWQLFAESPSFEAYQRLAQLHQQLGEPQAEFLQQVETLLSGKGEAVLAFYLEQQQWDKARGWVATNKAAGYLLLQLANAIMAEHPDEAITLHLRVVRVTIEQTENRAYQEAVKQLKHLRKLWKQHKQPAAKFDAAVRELAQTYKRKRNMLALLHKHFDF